MQLLCLPARYRILIIRSTIAVTELNTSFAPLLGSTVHTLVLGTMPGQKSLQVQQYYAHPRNALWPILCAMATGASPSYNVHTNLSYDERCTLITSAGYGLWDVLASCERPGSLDGNIVRESEVPNQIPALLGRHPETQLIVCNGRTAETLFKRHIQKRVTVSLPSVVCLPSTSPAMASLSLQDKFERWRDALLS